MRESEAVGRRTALGPGVRVGHRMRLDHQALEMSPSGQARSAAEITGRGSDKLV